MATPRFKESGKGQVTEEVVEQAVSIAGCGIEAFPTEHPELANGIRAVRGTPTRAWVVGDVRPNDGVGLASMSALLANRIGSFDPSPLASGEYPEVAERAVSGGIAPLSSKDPEASLAGQVDIAPSRRAPAWPGTFVEAATP